MRGFVALVAAFCAVAAFGQLVRIPARVDAETWSSPSGRFKLTVVPSATDGARRGLYRLERDGKTLWSRALPFTLCNVAVDDNGVGGYTSYSFDVRPHVSGCPVNARRQAGHAGNPSSLSCRKTSTTRLAVPNGRDVFIDAKRGRLVFDMNTLEKNYDKSEHWWVFDLNTGRRLAKLSRPYPGHTAPDYRYVAPKQPVLAIHPPAVNLRLDRRWVIPLQDPLPVAFRDLRAFRFLGRDRIVGIHQMFRPGIPVVDPDMIVADLSGRVLFNVPVKGQVLGSPMLTSTGGSTFLVAYRHESPPLDTELWSFDASTGVLTRLPTAKNFWTRNVAGFKDGRFALQSLNDVQIYDPHGRFLKQAERRPDGPQPNSGPSPFPPLGWPFSPTTIEVSPDGRLAVVGENAVRWYDENGRFLSEEKIPDIGLNGHARFLASGDLWIVDRLFLMDIGKDNRGSRQLFPAFKDGRLLSEPVDLQPDSLGRLWVSNDEGIFPLDSAGKLGDAMGAPPLRNAPSSVDQLVLTADGSAFALDRFTAKIYHYDREGVLQSVASPLPSDFAKWPPDLGLMAVTRDGHVHLNLGGFASKAFDHFLPNGARLGKESVDIGAADDSSEAFGRSMSMGTAAEDRGSWWCYERSLVDGSGRVRRTVTRWADKTWLQGTEFTVAPDGELMAVGGRWQGDSYGARDPSKLGFFSEDGEPISVAPLPPGLGEIHSYQCAFDGRLAYIFSHGMVYAFDRSGKAAWSFKPTRAPWQIQVSRGDLALFYGKTIEWYSVNRDQAHVRVSSTSSRRSLASLATTDRCAPPLVPVS